MKRIEFLSGMAKIQCIYPNNKSEFNEAILNCWYSFFENIPDGTMDLIVKTYSINECFAPQSPTHFLKHYKELIIKQYKDSKPKAIECWEHFLSLRNKNFGDVDKALSIIKKEDESLYNIFRKYASEIKTANLTDLEWIKKNFIKEYDEQVEYEMEEKIYLEFDNKEILLK